MCEREEKREMANMANVLGLIFANMHEQSVADLTKQRTLASVPFGGRYRMIDFPLSNMVNSDIDNVGIITKDNYLSLMDHLGSGDEWDLSRKTGGMHLLPPYGNSNALYRGRLEAMAQVKPFIESSNAEYVLLSDADVVANIDYRPIIDFHEKKRRRHYCCIRQRNIHDRADNDKDRSCCKFRQRYIRCAYQTRNQRRTQCKP